MNYGQREVSHSVVSMEVCSENSVYPGTVSVQQPVVSGCSDLTVVNEVSECSHNPSSRSTLPMTGEARSVNSALHTAVEARRKLENTINEVGSQTRSQLSVFRPVEFESTPVSSYPRRGRVRSEAVPEVAQQGKSNGYSRLDDEVSVRYGASGQPVRVTPRQPHSQSLVDPATPTRVFGSTGQREVTVVKRGRDKPVVEALISGGDINWSWSSVEQLGQAVDELVRGPNSQSLSSQGSLSAANVEVEELSPLVVNAFQSQGPVSLPLQPFTDQAQSPVCQREPCRPVCHSAPQFESHVDRDPPAHRRAEFPAIDGAVYFPLVVTSTCGPLVDNGRVGQPAAGSGEDRNGQRHGQRDVGSTVVSAGSQLPVAAATADLDLSDCRTGQLRRDPAVVRGYNSRDVKESGAACSLAQGRAMVTGVSPSVPSGALGVSTQQRQRRVRPELSAVRRYWSQPAARCSTVHVR